MLTAASCVTDNRQLDNTLGMAGDNRRELESVLARYASDPRKQEAARWLIANMPGHSMMCSPGIQAFADSVMHHSLSTQRAQVLWDSLQAVGGYETRVTDITHLKADFLIDNIDAAFDAWDNSKWRDEVDFDRFKKFVLPYRVDNELLRQGWRDSLINTYAPLVAGCASAKEAFEKIRATVSSAPRMDKYDFPYMMDAVAMRNYYSWVCIERCVFLANVCRALGLPVVIDNCGRWANYSDNSHTWVALVLADGTYTVVDEDSVAKKHNIIDAATFKLNQSMPEGYPYTPEFRKRLVKVWRQTFHLNPVDSIPIFKGNCSLRLSSPWLEDVSADYGIDGKVTVMPTIATDDVWLCTHSLTSGWIPQAHASVKRGAATFENISDSVMLLPMGIADGKEMPAGLPFYLSDGKKVEISPDTTRLISATLSRKYPMNAGWLNRYSQIPGARFEGCDRPDFINPDTLFTIVEVPVFYNSVSIDSDKPYRYFRIIADLPSYANMDRFNIYDKAGQLILSEKWEKKPYLDLGSAVEIGMVEFFPWNDGNFVLPGHEYQLVCWNQDHWQPIARQVSPGYALSFSNIPAGALLILHDLTEGKEERPFTLTDSKQIWW